MTETQKQAAAKYAVRYPHLAKLVERAEHDPTAANMISSQVGVLAAPATVTPLEVWALSGLGVR